LFAPVVWAIEKVRTQYFAIGLFARVKEKFDCAFHLSSVMEGSNTLLA
jgi:hypothetical protein